MEHKVLHCFFFISACWASGAVHPSDALEVLVYWHMSEPELRYATCVGMAELFVPSSPLENKVFKLNF